MIDTTINQQTLNEGSSDLEKICNRLEADLMSVANDMQLLRNDLKKVINDLDPDMLRCEIVQLREYLIAKGYAK